MSTPAEEAPPSVVPAALEKKTETAEELAARVAECKEKHIQCIKFEYLVPREPTVEPTDDRDGAPSEKRERGMNKKRPRDAKSEVTKSSGDPAGRADEMNMLGKETIHALQKKKYEFSSRPALEERKLVDFRDKVYVAPLTTVGNLPFRRIVTGLGADITCGEMSTADNLCTGQSSEWALIRRHKDEKCFGVQVTSGNPDKMGHACQLLHQHCEVDFVDINMGCPIECICKAGGGASLMIKPTKMKNVVAAALTNFGGSVTIKLRTGWRDDTPLAHTLVGYAQSWSAEFNDRVAAVFVHGRSRTARYSRGANWDYIEHVAACQDDSVKSLHIIGNGDIFSYADWEAKKATAPSVARCPMLARGVLIKPWLPTEIKEKRAWDISSSERLDILRKFAAYGLEHWGTDDCGISRTRRFLLEWLSFLCRYTPVGVLEVLPQALNERPPQFVGRNDLETLMASSVANDWLKLANMVLPPAPESFNFQPKHKSNAYDASGGKKAADDWG